MRIAIIGSGISGNVAASLLRARFDITVFEQNKYAGGHTNTVEVCEGGRRIPVDTGFIVYNETTYPEFSALLRTLEQPTQRSTMSFSVHHERDAFEYCGSSLNGLLAQRSCVLRPSFYRLVRDILRFFRDGSVTTPDVESTATIRQFLAARNYSNEFAERYLLPMVAAIWSAEPRAALDMPITFLLRFFRNHGLLQLSDRPQWRVISGGSQAYVARLIDGHRSRIRFNTPVTSVRRESDRVVVTTGRGKEQAFDYIVMACHSDEALALLADPTMAEREVLGAIPYQENEAVLHTDIGMLPRRKRAWAAWNYYVAANPGRRASVTYNMNILQGIDAARTYCVTLNDTARISPAKIIHRVNYSHPVFTLPGLAAQTRQRELNSGRTVYCGAYWRNGFHEDGVVSAQAAVRHLEENIEHAELYLRRAG